MCSGVKTYKISQINYLKLNEKIFRDHGYSDIINQISDNSQCIDTISISLCGEMPGKVFYRNLSYPQNQRPF